MYGWLKKKMKKEKNSRGNLLVQKDAEFPLQTENTPLLSPGISLYFICDYQDGSFWGQMLTFSQTNRHLTGLQRFMACKQQSLPADSVQLHVDYSLQIHPPSGQ